MSRRIRFVIGFAVLGVVIVAVTVFLATNLTQPVVDLGDQFMKAIQNHDMAAGYNMLSSALQSKVSEATFKDTFENASVARWSYSSRSIRNGVGQLLGQATIDDKTFNVQLTFLMQDGKWVIDGYSFNQ